MVNLSASDSPRSASESEIRNSIDTVYVCRACDKIHVIWKKDVQNVEK